MVSINLYWVAALMVAFVAALTVFGLGVVLLAARGMRETNAAYQKQLSDFGCMWVSLFEFQEHEVNRYRAIANDAERRFWAAARIANGDTKGKMKDVAAEMLGAPSAVTPAVNSRKPRRRGALTGEQELAIARRGNLEAVGLSLNPLEAMDGKNSPTTD